MGEGQAADEGSLKRLAWEAKKGAGSLPALVRFI
jgi:hypothetical protein